MLKSMLQQRICQFDDARILSGQPKNFVVVVDPRMVFEIKELEDLRAREKAQVR